MKKVFLSAALMIGLFSYSFAQTITKEKKQTTHKTTVTPKQGDQSKTTTNTTVTKNNTTGQMDKTSTKKVKKDGTPDKPSKPNKK